MKKIFNTKIFNVLILFFMICSCIFITGCKQKEVTEEEMDEWLITNFEEMMPVFASTYPFDGIISCGVYKKPQVTTEAQYTKKYYDTEESEVSSKMSEINKLLFTDADTREKLDLTFSEMYNKAVKEKMRMVIYKQYHERSEKYEITVVFLSKDGFLYEMIVNEVHSSDPVEYTKAVYKYTLEQGTSVYKEIVNYA